MPYLVSSFVHGVTVIAQEKQTNSMAFNFPRRSLLRPVWHAKPGTAQVGAISKAQKDSKTTFSTSGDNKSSQKTKN